MQVEYGWISRPNFKGFFEILNLRCEKLKLTAIILKILKIAFLRPVVGKKTNLKIINWHFNHKKVTLEFFRSVFFFANNWPFASIFKCRFSFNFNLYIKGVKLGVSILVLWFYLKLIHSEKWVKLLWGFCLCTRFYQEK
jgi:hypothetical protein